MRAAGGGAGAGEALPGGGERGVASGKISGEEEAGVGGGGREEGSSLGDPEVEESGGDSSDPVFSGNKDTENFSDEASAGSCSDEIEQWPKKYVALATEGSTGLSASEPADPEPPGRLSASSSRGELPNSRAPSRNASYDSLMSLGLASEMDEDELENRSKTGSPPGPAAQTPEPLPEDPGCCFPCLWKDLPISLPQRRKRNSKLDKLTEKYHLGRPVFKILYCIPQVLPNIQACGLALVSPPTWRSIKPEIGKLLVTKGSRSSRDKLTNLAQACLNKRQVEMQDLGSSKDALPAIRMANTMTFAEPLFSSESLLFGVLVCISVRPGFSMVDREALKMTTYMMSTYHGLSQSQEGSTVGSRVGGVKGLSEIRLSGTGDTFVASFAPRGRKKVEIAAEPTRLRRWSYGSAHSGDSLLDLVTFDLDPYTKDDKELVDMVMAMLNEHDTLKNLGISTDVMYNIVLNIKDQYLDVPFHNFRHAFMVLQISYLIVKESPLLKRVLGRPEHRFALLVSALCHDIGHPGNNNDFEIRTKSDRALLYSDQSVLENFHCRLASETLLNYKVDKLMPPGTWKSFRSCMIKAILSTDMKHHTKLKTELYKGLRNPDLVQVSDWVAYLVHAADLGSLTLKWELAKGWEERLFDEFSQQAAKEKMRGLPVTPYMSGQSNTMRSDIQLGFIENILLPWWQSLSQLVPQIAPRVAILKKNYSRYIAPIDTGGIKLQFQQKMRPRADSFAVPASPAFKSSDGRPAPLDENPFKQFNAY